MFSLLQAVPRSLVNPFKASSLDDTFSRFNRVYLFTLSIIFGLVVTINDISGKLYFYLISTFLHSTTLNFILMRIATMNVDASNN